MDASAPTKRKARDLLVPIAPEISQPEAVVVLSAVTVPPDTAPKPPNAELTSRFVIGPRSDSQSDSATSHENTNNAHTHPDIDESSPARPPSGPGNQSSSFEIDPGSLNQSIRNPETSLVMAPGSGKEFSNERLSYDHAPAGISVSGGSAGRADGAATRSRVSPRSYALTIISGGSSGGATRDLGVFARTDIVYTVYIPMTDVGGGSDWPMQYTLISPVPNRLAGGVLTPPVA